MLQLFTSLTGFLALVAATPTPSKRDTGMVTSWKDVPVSADLNYVPCFQNFTCAYLQVPLDYDDPSAGTTNIAFLKHTSPSPSVMGDIIFNPGGPGESGVEEMVSSLALLVKLLGDSYNIVGMDPRGVGESGPNTNCFLGNTPAGQLYTEQNWDVEPSSNYSVTRYYEMSGTYGTWCGKILNDTVRYVNTPATARDMLQYFEKLAASQGQGSNCSEALVNYYGLSYGTALGATFAALYPDRVGRFVLDGVVDSVDYYFGNWSQNILQADQAVESFFSYCAKASPELCLLNNNGTATADQMKTRVDKLLDTLETDPLPVADPNVMDFPTTITSMNVRLEIQTAMYDPASTWYDLAAILVELEQGNGTLMAKAQGKGDVPSNETAPPNSLSQWPIACNDNNHHYQGTLASLFKLFDYNQRTSYYLGDIWTLGVVAQCRNFNFTPPDTQLFKGFKQSQTKTPILFIDNKIDPITSAYYKMSAFFQGSAVLLQDAVGHGTFYASGNCTNGYVQKYLQTAQLPPPNTMCDSDFTPFVAPKST